MRTVQFAESGSEVVALFQDSLSAAFDEGVEFGCECCHALAQVFEVEVDIWELGELAVGVGKGCGRLRLRGAKGRGAGGEIGGLNSDCGHDYDFALTEVQEGR